MSAIADQLKKHPPKKPALGPVWEGPAGAGPQGGVTQSLIAKYLTCKERFRLYVVEGLKPRERFEHRLEYGNMWHICEEAFAAEKRHFGEEVGTTLWEDNLKEYVAGLCKKYPLEQEEIAGWYEKCRALFPLYRHFWAHHQDVKDRIPLSQEKEFDVHIQLPSGRSVRGRGKWDSNDAVNKRSDKVWQVFIGENKTKSQIDKDEIAQQLTFDLQTMWYLCCADTPCGEATIKAMLPAGKKYRLAGVRYNAVRRSAHRGGRSVKVAGIKRPQTSVESMLEKLGKDLKSGREGEWFARWEVEVSSDERQKFRRQCLWPILDNMLDDWEWWAFCNKNGNDPFDYQWREGRFGYHRQRHFRTPYFYNPLAEGRSTGLGQYLDTGMETGLMRTDNLFPELG